MDGTVIYAAAMGATLVRLLIGLHLQCMQMCGVLSCATQLLQLAVLMLLRIACNAYGTMEPWTLRKAEDVQAGNTIGAGGYAGAAVGHAEWCH